MLSLSELAKIHKKKQKNKTKTYNVILNKCHNQIRNMAKKDQTFCYYIVPLYVLGLPLYDINACIVYLILSLKKKGFLVQMADAQTLYISWKHIYEKQSSLKHKDSKSHINYQQQNEKYKKPLAITYNPSNQMNRFNERSKHLL